MTSTSRSTIEELLGLIGSSYRLLVADWESSPTGEGGDVDAAVESVDSLWPLRLPEDWRLCQSLRYDVTGWYWVVRRHQEVLKLDSLDDPDGIGKYRFPTSALMAHEGPFLPPAVLASYLTSKRLRKGIRASDYWHRISQLASADPKAFSDALSRLFGTGLGAQLADEILEQGPLSDASWSTARRAQSLRIFRNPWAFAKLQVMRATRLAGRIARPAGLVVLIAGPDGAGKSTLAEALPESCQGLFRRFSRQHWRPGILPAPGKLAGSGPRDTTRPHEFPPHGRLLSLGLLAYHWLDFFIGGWIRWLPARIKTTLVIVERGWWDIAVDPRRYRLDIPIRFVNALGRALPQPDLLLILKVPSPDLVRRKGELDLDEASRQTAEWERLPVRTDRLIVDAANGRASTASQATEALVTNLEARAVSRLGHGWTGLPHRQNPRWTLPRGPRATARASLNIYQPTSAIRKIGWEGVRILAALGGLRVLPRASAPPAQVRRILAPHIQPRGTVAVARTNHASRYVALLLDDSGHASAFAKIALDAPGREKLRGEADNLAEFGKLLQSPLRTPAIIRSEPGLLLMEAVSWKARVRPWMLRPEPARAMGAFSTNGNSKFNGHLLAHGDFAPWNLLKGQDKWFLLDWEDAGGDFPAFFDLFHFLVQGYSRLGKPTLQDIKGMFDGKGWTAEALASFADGAGLDVEMATDAFRTYIEFSKERLDLGTSEGLSGLGARQRLLRVVP